MLEAARDRLEDPSFWPVAADGQALPFKDDSFDAIRDRVRKELQAKLAYHCQR
jgi:ubiquinone/menaquinone biosynthesis C-methylase UbiE